MITRPGAPGSTALLLLALTACGGGSGGDVQSSLVVTGTLSAASQARAVNVADVKQVVAFSSESNGWTTSVADDGRFSIGVDAGAPVGLVFAGADDQCLGYVRLQNGLESIPLQRLNDGVTQIELGALAIDAVSCGPVQSAEDLSDAMALSDIDQSAASYAESFFTSVVRSPDVDGDGRIDLLEGRFYRPFVTYFVQGGVFSGSSAVPAGTTDFRGFRFSVQVDEQVDAFPSSVTFTGPDDSGLWSSPTVSDAVATETGSAIYSSPCVQSDLLPIPPSGAYAVTYGDRTLTFQIPDQTAATDHVALAVPTLTVNSDQTLHGLSWIYLLGGAADATIDPVALIHDLVIQIDGYDQTPAYRCDANGGATQEFRMYNSPNLAPAVTEHVLDGDCQNIPMSAVKLVNMAYNDVYGNHMVVTWSLSD